MKALAPLLSLVCAGAVFTQPEKEERVHVAGVLRLQVFPGRPNYQSVEKGDEPETAWILTVTTAEQKREEFQLTVLDHSEATLAALRRSIGKRIEIEGLRWEAQTGHHHTPFLITVRTIKEGLNKAPKPVRPEDSH